MGKRPNLKDEVTKISEAGVIFTRQKKTKKIHDKRGKRDLQC